MGKHPLDAAALAQILPADFVESHSPETGFVYDHSARVLIGPFTTLERLEAWLLSNGARGVAILSRNEALSFFPAIGFPSVRLLD